MKVVVIGTQGSGTNILRSFLNSHEDIEIFYEIFTRSPKWSGLRLAENGPEKYLENFESDGDSFSRNQWRKGNPHPQVFGFDLKYDNIIATTRILSYLIDSGWYCLHVKRDPARTFMRRIALGKVDNLSLNDWNEHLSLIKEWEHKIDSSFPKERLFEVQYENMTRGKEIIELPIDFEQEILNFLGVNHKKLSVSLNRVDEIKTKKTY